MLAFLAASEKFVFVTKIDKHPTKHPVFIKKLIKRKARYYKSLKSNSSHLGNYKTIVCCLSRLIQARHDNLEEGTIKRGKNRVHGLIKRNLRSNVELLK